MASPAPFSRYEFLIAWRYLRARRAEGGVSVMTWISMIGIALGVMALIATLAVRTGFRTELVDATLGANAHTTVYTGPQFIENDLTGETYVVQNGIKDYLEMAERLAAVPGVTHVTPVVSGQGMLSANDNSNVAQVFGITLEDLKAMPRIVDPQNAMGNVENLENGIAIGSGIARDLALGVGDTVQLMAAKGAQTAFGTAPRVKSYEVVFIFQSGRPDVDRARAYLPMEEAQSYFNREGAADEIQVYVDDPESVADWTLPLMQAAGEGAQVWSWLDASGGYLQALDMEDDVMFVIMSVLVLIASMNITSGLIMLVKNKGRDIGILRTMGLTEGAVLRVFFLCGAFTGIIGTIVGVVLGVLLALNVDSIMAAINFITDGGAWQPEVRGIYRLPAELRLYDILRAVGLSLTLSFIVTIFPARRAARMNPVEALRYE